MSEPDTPTQDDALIDLAVKQVIEGLSPAEKRALDAMDGERTRQSLLEFERAAAAVGLAASLEPLPAGLRARLLERAAEVTAQQPRPAGTPITAPVSTRTAPRGSNFGWLAAAACLVLALFGWFRSPPAPPSPPVAAVMPPVDAPVAPTPPPTPTPAEERAALLAKDGVLKVPLGATKDPAAVGVTGDVVWDAATQRGFLHFAGLAPNDPNVHQYQIWIFDGARDKRYPIDGGVFDVPAGTSEIVIPIRAELSVRKAAAFAVTIEKPGGVVVSSRDHVIVLGATS